MYTCFGNVIRKASGYCKDCVKNMPQSNMYGASAAEIWELFDAFLSGEPSATSLALSTRPLGDAPRNALQKSFQAFGYGAQPCTFATIEVEGPDASNLDARALFMLIEGLDPVYLVCCDDQAARLLEAAYGSALPRDDHALPLGRNTVVFADLARMLETDGGKQRAWALLKRLQ